MTYFEVDADRVYELLHDLFEPVVTENITKKNVMKLYPAASTEIARRSGMIQALYHLDLITDQERDHLKDYLELELKKFVSVMGLGKLFK